MNEARIAVTLHDIEPATFEHCRLIRDWLDGLGVRRATLVVVPPDDLHPSLRRSPALDEWLRERRNAGDGVVEPAAAGRERAVGALRVDLGPQDFDCRPARVRALERRLRAEAARRRPVTLDELVTEGVRPRQRAGRILRAG